MDRHGCVGEPIITSLARRSMSVIAVRQAEAVLPSEVNELVARRRHDATEWAESDTLVHSQ
jgi:hypothetical protein